MVPPTFSPLCGSFSNHLDRDYIMKTTFKQRSAHLAWAAAIVAVFCGASSAAYAGTATSSMPVSATVAASCTIDATTALAFGAYDPIVTNATSPLTGSVAISTTCTNGSPATITLGQGANADASSTAAAPLRRMLTGTTFLNYNLYSDAGNTTVWGDTSVTGVPVTGTGAALSTTVYGSIAAGQNVISGSYTDTVLATVTF